MRPSRRQALWALPAPLATLALLTAAQPAMAQANAGLEPAGVRYPAHASVAGQALVLNGAGTRYKAVFKVYTAGLYLPSLAGNTEAVLA